MSKSTGAIVALTVTSLVALCEAGAFLDARAHKKDGMLSIVDVESAMYQLSEMGGPELDTLEAEIRPMFVALPKNEFGYLEPATVRYALHRHFVQKHGWFMTGFESGEVANTSGQASIMVDRAPALVQSLLEKRRTHSHGMDLKDVAIFAGVLTSLIHAEVTGAMHTIWNATGLPMDGHVDDVQVQQAIKTYMMFYILEEEMKQVFSSKLDSVERVVRDIYPVWDDTLMWVNDFRQTEEFMQSSRSNLFRQQPNTFESTVKFAQQVTHHFSSFQRLECATLKNQLLELEHQGTGRVLLSRFYSGALGGDWTFAESPEWLRHLGVLDEIDPSKPVVVIPNYIVSKTNCLVGSGFYSLCCADECEGLMRHVEAKVAAPSADPKHIAAIVASLPSDTVDAPRNLSSALLDRLSDIASVHGGSVPLHGRLFAQWMHHVYPRECSHPAVGVGNKEPIMPAKDWMEKYGDSSLEATEEAMQMHVNNMEKQATAEVFIPWSAKEELVAEQYQPLAAKPWSVASFRTGAALMALVSFAGAITRTSSFNQGHSKPESVMV